jgi:hypothetical protein
MDRLIMWDDMRIAAERSGVSHMTGMMLTLLLVVPMAVLAQAPTPPRLVFAFELHAQVAPPLVVGDIAAGTRRIVQITGGTFEGPGIKGKVLPGGADWQIIHADGFSELDTRYTIETDTGKTIYVQNAGMRHAPPDVMKQLLAGQPVDPALVYFRTIPKFETAAPELQWLTRAVFIGVGERQPADVLIRFWRVE